jgi:hypothetical protein
LLKKALRILELSALIYSSLHRLSLHTPKVYMYKLKSNLQFFAHFAFYFRPLFLPQTLHILSYSAYSYGSRNFLTSARHVSRKILKGFDDISSDLFSPASSYYPFRCYTNAVLSLCTFLLVLFGLLSTLVKGRLFLTTHQPWKTLFAYSFHTLCNPLTCPSDKHSPIWLSLFYSCNLQQLNRHWAYCESASWLVSKVLTFMETDSLLLYLHKPATWE